MQTTVFKLAIASIFIASSASAGVSASGLTSGFIKSVDVRVDAKIVGVSLVCGNETGVIKFDKKSYAEGLALMGLTGKYFRTLAFNRSTEPYSVSVANYSLSDEQPEADLPGTIRCK